jgi:hypothetical protein
VSIEDGLQILLQLLNKHEIKATFFVPGKVAEKHVEAIGLIGKDGHEVACHGLYHEKNECLLSMSDQRNRIKEASRIIARVHGAPPRGFRAPCLRINNITLDVLEECGYTYDSSILPTSIPGYYGSPMAPTRPYNPSQLSIRKKGSLKLLEIPVSINPVVPIPLSAAWMRNLGLSWVKFGLRTNFALGNPVVFYIHPRDVVSLPKIRGVPWHVYRNTGKKCLRVLDELLKYVKQSGCQTLRAIDFALGLRSEKIEV